MLKKIELKYEQLMPVCVDKLEYKPWEQPSVAADFGTKYIFCFPNWSAVQERAGEAVDSELGERSVKKIRNLEKNIK